MRYVVWGKQIILKSVGRHFFYVLQAIGDVEEPVCGMRFGVWGRIHDILKTIAK